MRTKLFSCGLLVGASLVNYAFADNCTGYDTIVTTSSETRDLGNGMKLTTFQAESALLSQDSVYNLVVGQCSGTSLSTPDGKTRASGHCARRDKDGDTESISWENAPGAEKGTWKATGGTGKFAKTGNDSGWSQAIMADGKVLIVKWGGNCK